MTVQSRRDHSSTWSTDRGVDVRSVQSHALLSKTVQMRRQISGSIGEDTHRFGMQVVRREEKDIESRRGLIGRSRIQEK